MTLIANIVKQYANCNQEATALYRMAGKQYFQLIQKQLNCL